MRINWRKAKRNQLYEIAYNDPGASVMHREQAKAEIARRVRTQHTTLQIKIKPKY